MSPPQVTLAPPHLPAHEMRQLPREQPAPFSAAVVVPTYHNAGTLAEVLRALDALELPIVVVDDGCQDESPEILAQWASAAGSAPRHVERHPVNRGKGAALGAGFRAATALGATHAVTIDSDGQHDAADIPALLDAARGQPRALVIGVRPREMPGRPARCLVGLRLANALVALQCRQRLADTQSGLRVYPLDFAAGAPCRSERFSYETESLILAAREGRPVIERPINCRYFPRDQRVSHWRPVIDTARDVRLHARLALAAVKRG